MIDYPIIDTHLHLWDTKKFRYPIVELTPGFQIARVPMPPVSPDVFNKQE